MLHKDFKGKQRVKTWNYLSLIGILTHLQETSRPDIAMIVHQCARFSKQPILSHEIVVKIVSRYLLETKHRGLICKVNKTKELECFINVDFSRGWTLSDPLTPDTIFS